MLEERNTFDYTVKKAFVSLIMKKWLMIKSPKSLINSNLTSEKQSGIINTSISFRHRKNNITYIAIVRWWNWTWGE